MNTGAVSALRRANGPHPRQICAAERLNRRFRTHRWGFPAFYTRMPVFPEPNPTGRTVWAQWVRSDMVQNAIARVSVHGRRRIRAGSARTETRDPVALLIIW